MDRNFRRPEVLAPAGDMERLRAALYGAGRLGWQVIPCSEAGEPLPPEEIASRVWEAAAPLLSPGQGGEQP